MTPTFAFMFLEKFNNANLSPGAGGDGRKGLRILGYGLSRGGQAAVHLNHGLINYKDTDPGVWALPWGPGHSPP